MDQSEETRVGESGFGAMKGSAEELEDILDPLPEADWEALDERNRRPAQ